MAAFQESKAEAALRRPPWTVAQPRPHCSIGPDNSYIKQPRFPGWADCRSGWEHRLTWKAACVRDGKHVRPLTSHDPSTSPVSSNPQMCPECSSSSHLLPRPGVMVLSFTVHLLLPPSLLLPPHPCAHSSHSGLVNCRPYHVAPPVGSLPTAGGMRLKCGQPPRRPPPNRSAPRMPPRRS